jgi:hypothetical protein
MDRQWLYVVVGDRCPGSKKVPNAPSALDHRECVTSVIKEMVEAGALIRLPKYQRPTVIILVGVVRKPRSDKFRLVTNTRYMSKHLAKKVFKFEGWSDSADIVEKRDHSV